MGVWLCRCKTPLHVQKVTSRGGAAGGRRRDGLEDGLRARVPDGRSSVAPGCALRAGFGGSPDRPGGPPDRRSRGWLQRGRSAADRCRRRPLPPRCGCRIRGRCRDDGSGRRPPQDGATISTNATATGTACASPVTHGPCPSRGSGTPSPTVSRPMSRANPSAPSATRRSTRDGCYLYALDVDAGQILGWSVGAGGQLTPTGGSKARPPRSPVSPRADASPFRSPWVWSQPRPRPCGRGRIDDGCQDPSVTLGGRFAPGSLRSARLMLGRWPGSTASSNCPMAAGPAGLASRSTTVMTIWTKRSRTVAASPRETRHRN